MFHFNSSKNKDTFHRKVSYILICYVYILQKRRDAAISFASTHLYYRISRRPYFLGKISVLKTKCDSDHTAVAFHQSAKTILPPSMSSIIFAMALSLLPTVTTSAASLTRVRAFPTAIPTPAVFIMGISLK